MPEGLSALMLRVTLDNTGRESLDRTGRRTPHAQLGIESTAQRVKPSGEFADESFVRVFFQPQRGELLIHDPDGPAQGGAGRCKYDQVIQVAHIKDAATMHAAV